MKKFFLISIFLSFYVFPINAHEEDPLNDCMDLLESYGKYTILDIANSCSGATTGTLKCIKRVISGGGYLVELSAARACTKKNES